MSDELSTGKVMAGLGVIVIGLFGWFFQQLVSNNSLLREAIATGQVRLAVIEERLERLEDQCK